MESIKTGYRRTVNARVWEKILFSAAFGLLISVLLWKNWTNFLDTFTMLFLYSIWMTCFLPSLYKKLTMKFTLDVIAVLSEVFFADIAVFGIYRTLRSYQEDVEVTYEAFEQRAYIFLMNCVRICVVCYCVLGSLPAFIRETQNKKKRKKRKTF